jgi:hypothetical protein
MTSTHTHAGPAAEVDQPEQSSTATTSRRRTITTALLVVLALLLGGITGYGLTRLGVPGDDAPEAGFARDMSTHHGQSADRVRHRPVWVSYMRAQTSRPEAAVRAATAPVAVRMP